MYTYRKLDELLKERYECCVQRTIYCPPYITPYAIKAFHTHGGLIAKDTGPLAV